MNKEKIYKTPQSILENSNISETEFNKLYKQSLENPEEFWADQADLYLDWDEQWTKVKENDIERGQIIWFKDGKLNASVNCIDTVSYTHLTLPTIVGV